MEEITTTDGTILRLENEPPIGTRIWSPTHYGPYGTSYIRTGKRNDKCWDHERACSIFYTWASIFAWIHDVYVLGYPVVILPAANVPQTARMSIIHNECSVTIKFHSDIPDCVSEYLPWNTKLRKEENDIWIRAINTLIGNRGWKLKDGIQSLTDKHSNVEIVRK